MKKKTVIFMGTPQIAAAVLKALLAADIDIALVVTQPDKKVGRKQKVVYSAVKQIAVEHDIPCFQPYRIKDDHQEILDIHPDLIITCAYGQIVPDTVLNCPKWGCVNLHGSLLPKYRGGAPIQRALWNGESYSGMSLMKMVRAMDAGPVLAAVKIQIEPSDNATSLFEKMGVAAGQLMVDSFELVCSHEARYVEQDSEAVTYAPIITKAEEHLDLAQSDERIINQIRALSWQPGAYVYIEKKKWKILAAGYEKGDPERLGRIKGWYKDAFAIDLHEGYLLVHCCQMEGKPVLSSKDFYNGQGRSLVGKTVE